MDYRRRRTDVVLLRLFMCFKGGSSIPRVHGPRYPNSAARQYSAFADQLLACFAPARASIPMSLALSLLIIFLQSLPIESGKTPDSMTAAFQIISRVELP